MRGRSLVIITSRLGPINGALLTIRDRGVRVLSPAFGPPYLASAGVPRAGLLRVGVGRDTYYKNETMPINAP